MSKRTYTILVVPENSAQVRRIKIQHRWLLQAGLVGVVLVGLMTFGAVHYAYVIDQAAENRVLKDENVMLQTRLMHVHEEISRVDDQLRRIDQLAVKLRALTKLNDPGRELAIGPLSKTSEGVTPRVLYAPDERIDFEDELMDSELAIRLADTQLSELSDEAESQQSNIRELHQYFTQDALMMASMPSIRPTRSRMTSSGFGLRTDPYTNHRVMHKGIDIAAEHGSDVYATGDGIVVFVGNRGGYGKSLVVDHGYGYQTHYTHLSSYSVTVGQSVKRGQSIAGVGNTGRSTGSHLHYEVRFQGVPQDPERYFLD